MEWADSVAFITGGAQGIGLGIARALAKRKVRLVLADIDRAALDRSGSELSAATTVQTLQLDVQDRVAFAEAADQIERTLGPVDLLFNNAGIAPFESVPTLRYEQWDLVLGVNLHGVINGVQTFLPRMIERGGGGYIVNTASGAGLVAGPNMLYTTSKFAIVGLSESLQQAVGKYDIGVSVLCPGFVDTDILSNTVSAGDGILTEWDRKVRSDQDALFKTGPSIDVVGEMVLAGMERRSMWIHTDDMTRTWVSARVENLLASLPTPAAERTP